jgi:ADP-heptose:LPS heptosyltransferase
MKPRLLVVELHHLGDAVMSLPFVRGASSVFDVHVLCRPATRSVYELLETPPTLHAWDPPWGEEQGTSPRQTWRALRKEGRRLRAVGFDTAVGVWADVRGHLLMYESGARQRVGFPMTAGNYYAADLPWRRQRLWSGRVAETFWRMTHPGTPLLTTQLHRRNPRQSHHECWAQIAEALGVACDYRTPWINAAPAPVRHEASRPLLAVHAHARLPSKQWAPDRWRLLLSSPELRAVYDILEVLPSGAEPVSADGDLRVVTPDLPSLAAVLAAADAMVGHDSLPAHLAAALGRPVVTIFGSGEPDWFAPFGQRDRVVQSRVCPLHPCIDRCGMDRYLCLEAVAVQDVLRQLLQLSRSS